ncbi:MAG: archaeosortase/exosortase family protein [Planctomycetota bacterium]
MWFLLATAALLWSFRGALASYLRDQHYQEHFLYLWVFLALALARSLRPPFRAQCGMRGARDAFGCTLAGSACLLFAISEVAGSSSGARTALVVFLTGVAVLAVPAWTVRRCLLHGLLMQLCFGLPYAVFFPLTAKLTWGVAWLVALPARLGVADYVVESSVVRFPHYQLVITPDCSGLGQLLTFTGIAALGVLSAARNWRRSVGLVVLAVALAWLSNVARVGFFVLCVAAGWTAAVDDGALHAGLGFLVFLPFVALLIGVILKTHVPLPPAAATLVRPGRWPIALLALPLLAISVLLERGRTVAAPAPSYFAQLEQPPGHRLELRAPSEAADQASYETPWLVNARFRGVDGGTFDLFHYSTSSRSHLCVHAVAACLGVPADQVRRAVPVTVAGRGWWRIGLDDGNPANAAHVYFAFEVGGERFDDSLATQWRVFRQRLLGGSWEVRFTRVMVPGPLPPEPGAAIAAVLGWLGELTAR